MGPLLFGMVLAASAPGQPADGPAGPPILIPAPRAGTMADLFLVDPATGDSKNVTRTEADEELYPAWSADGRRIAFTAKNRDHSFEVFVSDADGSDRKRLTTPPAGGPTMCLFPTWSADGKEVAYSRTDPAQKFE